MRPFRYERAADASAATALAAEADAMFLGGGTNLVDLMRLGVAEPALLVDVQHIGTDGIEESDDGGLRIGAAVRNSDLAADERVRSRYPALSSALLQGASGQLRNLATVGGNLLQRTRCVYFQDITKPCNKRAPGSGCPAREGEHRNLAILGWSEHCVATHPSDMAVALVALDATVHTSIRSLPLRDLHRLPGDEPQRDTVLEHGELIEAISLPPLPEAARSGYVKIRERASFSFAVVSVAAVLEVADGAVRDVRVALGGVAHAPWRATRLEEALRGRPADATSFGRAADAEFAESRPLRDNGYKLPLARNVLVRTLTEARGRRVTVAARRAVGSSVDRIEGVEKVTGRARYAYEHRHGEAAYAAIVQATIGKGRVRAVEAADALALPGVLAVLWHGNAPRLADVEGELALLQSDRVAYRGQVVALVVGETLEVAQEAQRLVDVVYEDEPHDVEFRIDHPGLYKPEKVNPSYDTDTSEGDVDGALAAAPAAVDVVYETPWFHNNPMEPHASIAVWEADGTLTVYDSTQGSYPSAQTAASAFGLEGDRVRVIAPHVGGGFGSKGTMRPQAILAAMAARVVGRPVKTAVTRQQMFELTGYRTPTIQRVRLGAERDGRLTAICHDVVEQTSTVDEFAEQTAVVTRMMYAAPNRRTTHRLVALDVPTPSWMRAPGECPGMYALESALDELAIALRLDPVELRIRNEPERDPESGLPFSSRNLVACLREGAARFGWDERDPEPRARRDGASLVGTGVAASTYPARRRPSEAHARREGDGFVVQVAAADIGTGARTALTQIAADALEVDAGRVRVEIGDSSFGEAPVAGGSAGTASWGTAVHRACRELVESGDDEVHVDTSDEIEAQEAYSRHAFGAQFVEVRVNAETGEIRVPRLLGVFAAGTIVNPKTARSQFIGGMTMGLGMALLEEGILDPAFGDVVNHDLATYHVPVYADVDALEAVWLDEEDDHLNPVGSKGIGEIGIVGTAAAVTNAVHHATGIRFHRLPIRLDQVVAALAAQDTGAAVSTTSSG